MTETKKAIKKKMRAIAKRVAEILLNKVPNQPIPILEYGYDLHTMRYD